VEVTVGHAFERLAGQAGDIILAVRTYVRERQRQLTRLTE